MRMGWMLWMLPTYALAAGPALTRSVRADVDGDGKAEPVTLKATGQEGDFTLKVGGQEVKGRVGTKAKGFRLVDLDASDKRQQVLVAGQGPNGGDVHVLYQLGPEGPRQLPLPECKPAVFGDGLLLTDCWMGFWERREKYTYDSQAGTFTHVPQQLYWVNKSYKVARSFPLYRGREGQEVVATVRQGSTLTFVAFWAGAQDSDWYLLRSESGLLGWARLSAIQEHLVGLVMAG